MFLNRHARCLDADVKHDDRNNHIFCQMGQGCQSVGPAHGNNDWSWSSVDCCTQSHVPTELGPPVHMARAMCNPEPLCNKRVWGTVGKDQKLGDNRRSCRVLQNLGRDLHQSFSASKHCEIPCNWMVAGIAYVVWDSKEKLIYFWGGEHQHANWSVCVYFFNRIIKLTKS